MELANVGREAREEARRVLTDASAEATRLRDEGERRRIAAQLEAEAYSDDMKRGKDEQIKELGVEIIALKGEIVALRGEVIALKPRRNPPRLAKD